MTPKQRSWIQVAVTALIMWSVVRVLGRFLPEALLWFFVITAAVVVSVIWLLRFSPQHLASVYSYRVAKESIDYLCKLTRLQPPVADARSRSKESEPKDNPLKADAYLLRTQEGFAQAGAKLKNVVRGHDKQIDQIMQSLANCFLLRQKRMEEVGLPPLAAFLFSGNDGVGKRFLARKLANLLYRRQSIVDVDLTSSSEGSMMTRVFGSAASDGMLTGVVRKRPHTMVIIQNIDLATPEFMSVLEAILSRGTIIDPFSNGQVSFRHCVFIFTTAQCREQLRVARDRAEGKRKWHYRAHEVLSTNTPLTLNLLGFLNEILLFGNLSPMEKAEVISLLMRKECRRYDLKLEYVDPEILAEQVELTTNETGFTTAPARISRLLHDPLVRASQDGLTSLVLRGNQITMVPNLDAYSQ